MFGAMVTVSGGGYVFLNDMRYDFSRWALSLVDDFGLESEYMYHADKIWEKYDGILLLSSFVLDSAACP